MFRKIIDYPRLVIFFTILFTIGLGYGSQYLGFEKSYKAFFNKDNPQLKDYEFIQDTFVPSDNVFIVIHSNKLGVLDSKNAIKIKRLTEEAWQLPYVARVDGLANYLMSYVTNDDIAIRSFISDQQLERFSSSDLLTQASKQNRLINNFISPDGMTSGINIRFALPMNSAERDKAIVDIAEGARNLAETFNASQTDLNAKVTGLIIQNYTFDEVGKFDTGVLMPFMFLGIFILLGLQFRSMFAVIGTLAVVLLSVISAMGVAGWLGVKLAGPSATAPLIILTIAVADCVHILTTLKKSMLDYEAKADAIVDTITLNLKPMALTSVTTAIGFLSMNFSEMPPFQDLGNIVAVGIIIAWLLSMTLFPAFLFLVPFNIKNSSRIGDFCDQMSVFVVRYRLIIISCFMLIALISSSGLIKNKIISQTTKYFDETVDFRIATEFMEDKLTGSSTIEYVFDSGSEGGVNDPSFMLLIEKFVHWKKQQDLTGHVDSFTDTIKLLNQQLHQDDQSYNKIPNDQALLSQLILLYEMSLPYGSNITNTYDINKQYLRVVSNYRDVTSAEILAIEKSDEEWWEKQNSNYDLKASSPSIMFSHMGYKNIKSMFVVAIFALILITVILGISVRSIPYALVSIPLHSLPVLIGFGMWGYFSGEIGNGLAMAIGISLGIIVDFTIHFMMKFKHAITNLNYTSEKAIAYTYEVVGQSLIVTSLLLITGFGILSLSTFKMNMDMGLMTLLIIIWALISDLLLLPALLFMINLKTKKKTSSTNYSENNYAKINS